MYTDWKRLPEQLEEGVNPQEIASGILLDRVCTVMQSRHGRINKWCGSLDYELENGRYSMGEINRRDIADEIRMLVADDYLPSD
jgi:hypothetical protein